MGLIKLAWVCLFVLSPKGHITWIILKTNELKNVKIFLSEFSTPLHYARDIQTESKIWNRNISFSTLGAILEYPLPP